MKRWPHLSRQRLRKNLPVPVGGCSPTVRCCGIRCFRLPTQSRRRCAGLHRQFCLWSLGSRGTVKVPGLVLGLDRGGSCHGVAYRLPARCARAELALLWRREMVVGSYKPRWLQVHSSGAYADRAGLCRQSCASAIRGAVGAGEAGESSRGRAGRVRVVVGLPRARTRRAGHPRHRRSLPGKARGGGRALAPNAVGISIVRRRLTVARG